MTNHMSKTLEKVYNLLLQFAEDVKDGKRSIISISDVLENKNEFTMTIKGLTHDKN